MCGYSCGDNRFEIIKKAKQHLLESTNISSSDDEMKVIDTFLFRCWQMGWLKIYEGQSETIESDEKRNQLDKPEEPQPKYRPYANAEELDEAIKEKGIWLKKKETGRRIAISYYDEKDKIFEHYYKYCTWLDGTPVGVKEKEKEKE